MIRMTNAQIGTTLANAVYRSIHTGSEVDRAVTLALGLREYLEQYVHIPFAEFTGDYDRITIGDFKQNVWLHSIIINCVRPFSKSVGKYKYWIELIDKTDGGYSGRLLQEIPHELMTEENLSVEYRIDRWLPANCNVDIVAESTNAFGRLDIKLVLA